MSTLHEKRNVENNPARFQNRKGPGGCDLDAGEAMAWFVDLDVTTQTLEPPSAGDSVLVQYDGLRFWLHDVELSVEPGFFFGNVEWPEGFPQCDEQYAHLGPDQNIGFEMRHVIAVQPSKSGHVPGVQS